MDVTLDTVQTCMGALLGLITIKAYFSYETRKNDRAEEGKEKRAETYANGKVREMRIEMLAETQGFDDTNEGGIEGLIQMVTNNPEIVDGLLKKK